MKRFAAIAISLGMILATGVAFAQKAPKVFVYPVKGQSKDQQKKDTYECQDWAAEQAPPSGAETGTGTHGKAVVGGAAKGAAVGAALGAIGGNAGKGAAAGAVVGGVGGRRGSKRQQQENTQVEQNDTARAFAACMESRGYTVK